MEDGIELTSINVKEGEKFLQKAARYKVAMYPLTGALIGTCIGGPIGLIAGLKVGGLTAIGCGLLGEFYDCATMHFIFISIVTCLMFTGFTGASLIKKKQIEMHKTSSTVGLNMARQTSLQKSISLPEDLKESKKEL